MTNDIFQRNYLLTQLRRRKKKTNWIASFTRRWLWHGPAVCTTCHTTCHTHIPTHVHMYSCTVVLARDFYEYLWKINHEANALSSLLGSRAPISLLRVGAPGNCQYSCMKNVIVEIFWCSWNASHTLFDVAFDWLPQMCPMFYSQFF